MQLVTVLVITAAYLATCAYLADRAGARALLYFAAGLPAGAAFIATIVALAFR